MTLTRQQLYKIEDQLEQLVPNLDAYNYYQLLGVDPQARDDMIAYTCNLRVAEYERIRGDKRCTASLFQNLGVLLERLEEARRILLDATLRAEYHQWLNAGHTRHWGANAKPREQEQRDEFIEEAARDLERKLGGKIVKAEDEEVDHGNSWTIDLGEGNEELASSGNIEGMEVHLRDELERLGVRDEEGEAEDESASLDAELLASTEAGLRAELDELGVQDEEGEAEDESASLDADYIAEAEAFLRSELAAMGVKDEDAADDASASIDAAYLEEAAKELARKLKKDGVRDEVGQEGTSASLDRAYIDEAVASLQRQLGNRHLSGEAAPSRGRLGKELARKRFREAQARRDTGSQAAAQRPRKPGEIVIDLDD